MIVEATKVQRGEMWAWARAIEAACAEVGVPVDFAEFRTYDSGQTWVASYNVGSSYVGDAHHLMRVLVQARRVAAPLCPPYLATADLP